jgi:hypothetical protein
MLSWDLNCELFFSLLVNGEREGEFTKKACHANPPSENRLQVDILSAGTPSFNSLVMVCDIKTTNLFK